MNRELLEKTGLTESELPEEDDIIYDPELPEDDIIICPEPVCPECEQEECICDGRDIEEEPEEEEIEYE